MKKKDAQPALYRVLQPIVYVAPDGMRRRPKPGEVASDIPAISIAWLLKDGLIEEVEAPEEGQDGKRR